MTEDKQHRQLRKAMQLRIHDALLGEVYTTPKPGLVDLHDNGAHRDMDVHTFERSTAAITPFLSRMFEQGYCARPYQEAGQPQDDCTEAERLFLSIRRTGIEAEQAMLRATGGVNTHKGMLFSMGITLAAYGNMLQVLPPAADSSSVVQEPSSSSCTHPLRAVPAESVLETAGRMTARILTAEFEQMQHSVPKTHGERLFRRFGERGIRGQAIEGFPILRYTALPAIRRYTAYALERTGGAALPPTLLNAVRLNTLLAVMAKLNDTNVLSRSNPETMLLLRQRAAKILAAGGAFREEGLSALSILNQECIRRNISPGGAADMLAVALLLHGLEQEIGDMEGDSNA